MSSMESNKKVVFTVRLSQSLHRKFKKLCVDLGNIDMTDVVRAMIRLFISDPEFRTRVLMELKTQEEVGV